MADIVIQKIKRREVVLTPVDTGAVWGNISGNISDQADLSAALNELRILAYAGL